jgi:hypothetical protein
MARHDCDGRRAGGGVRGADGGTMSINHYLGIVDGVMNFYCVRPDHSESVRDEHVLRRDYDALRSRLAAAETVLKMRPTMNMDQCETYCETAKLLVARAENAEAALAESDALLREINQRAQCVTWYDYSDDDEDVQTDIAQLMVVCKRIDAHLARKDA